MGEIMVEKRCKEARQFAFALLLLFFALAHQVLAHPHHDKKPERINHHHPIDYSKSKTRDDIILYLVQPYKNVIRGEGAHLYLGIRNDSNQRIGLNLAGDFSSDSLYASAQILVEATGSSKEINLTRPNNIPNWQQLTPMLNSTQDGYLELDPGENAIFGSKSEYPYDLHFDYDLYPQGAEQFRMALLTGPDEWALSNWESSATRLDIHRRNDSFTVGSLKTSPIEEYPVEQLSIGGIDYVFALGTRVCALPEGITPKIEQQGEGLETKLVISFPGTDYEPVIHHFNSMTTLSGPSELVPHLAALNELKVKLEADVSANEQANLLQSAGNSTPTSKPTAEKEQTEVVTTEPFEEPNEQSSNWWLWLIGAVVVVGGLALMLRRKGNTKGSFRILRYFFLYGNTKMTWEELPGASDR